MDHGLDCRRATKVLCNDKQLHPAQRLNLLDLVETAFRDMDQLHTGRLSMKARLVLSVFVLIFAPGLAFAQCAGKHYDEVTMSCPEGTVLNVETGICETITTS